MDENQLQQTLELYKAQLVQVTQQQTIASPPQTEELEALVADLKEIISLTEGSLLSLRKSKILQSLEDAESSSSTYSALPQLNVQSSLPSSFTPHGASQSSAPAASIDDEYAAFQAALQEDLEEDESSSHTPQPPSASATRGAAASQPPSSSRSSPLSFSPHPSSRRHPHDSSDSETSSSDDDAPQFSRTLSGVKGDDDSDASDDGGEGGGTLDEELTRLVGTKCCAPFSHDWGGLGFHNALVMSAVRENRSDKILVKVMFTTPTHSAMQPCKFYLDGHCKFDEDNCRYSHGRTVALKELRDFVEADNSAIAVGVKCLARYTDGIWYPATVTEVKDEVVSVHFDDYGEDLELDMTQVVPSGAQPEDTETNSEGEGEGEGSKATEQGTSLLLDSDEEAEELPTFLWQPPSTTSVIGEWEAHTRGVGSKLMSKMGFVPGQGLGARGQGKTEPVPIMLLPQGKSLDRIMQLKAMAGDDDIFNAMKRLERQQRKADKKREEAESGGGAGGGGRPPPGVFDFINKRLSDGKGDPASLSTSKGSNSSSGSKDTSGASNSVSKSRRNISEHELHKKTDKDINVQVFKTHEEMRNVQRQMDRLKEQLARNENKDRRMAAQVRAKLAEQETYLATLKTSSSALEKHQKKRTTSKKLAIF